MLIQRVASSPRKILDPPLINNKFFVFFLHVVNQGENPMPEVTLPPQNEDDLTTEDPTVEKTPESSSDEGNENTGT